jgi:hypothetical protein
MKNGLQAARTVFASVLSLSSVLAAQASGPNPVVQLGSPVAGILRGGTLSADGATLYAWGSALYRWKLSEFRTGAHGQAERLSSNLSFGESGCVAAVNGDGHADLVLEARPASGSGLGRLVWLEAPSWKVHLLDSGIEMSDCVETTLLGKRGILMVQRHAQVRFYPYPLGDSGHAPYQEVYSFYTPSRQAGLLRADVDGDGREDILCGNYWIQSPEAYNLPWRLFAIELYNQTESAASLRLALLGNSSRELVVAQKDMSEASVSLFRVPAGGDPKALWEEHPLAAPGGFHFPAGLAAMGHRIMLGEHNGASSRILCYTLNPDGVSFVLERATASRPVVALLASPTGVAVVYEDGAGVFMKTSGLSHSGTGDR